MPYAAIVFDQFKERGSGNAKYKSSQRGIDKLDHLPAETNELLIKWLAAMHRKGNKRRVPDKLTTIKDTVLGSRRLVSRRWSHRENGRLAARKDLTWNSKHPQSVDQ